MKKIGLMVLTIVISLGFIGTSDTVSAAVYDNATVNISGASSKESAKIYANGQGSISVVNTGKYSISYVIKKNGSPIGPYLSLAPGVSTAYNIPTTTNAQYSLQLVCSSGSSCSGMGVIANYPLN